MKITEFIDQFFLSFLFNLTLFLFDYGLLFSSYFINDIDLYYLFKFYFFLKINIIIKYKWLSTKFVIMYKCINIEDNESTSICRLLVITG